MTRQHIINHATAHQNDPIIEVINKITNAPSNGGASGIAVVVDDQNRVLGVLTDGDIRKAVYKNTDLKKPVKEIMNTTPVCVRGDLGVEEIIREATKKMRAKNLEINKIIQVDTSGRFVDIVELQRLYREADVLQKVVAVYGLGYVGLTLALTLAENRLFDVIGIDTNDSVIAQLKDGKTHFFEEGLLSLLRQVLEHGNITFATENKKQGADVHIISVGTPVDNANKPVMDYLKRAGEM
ncbi:MAG: CBS domain-containing protein, partial [Deltaproteobacteria bacterium]|nr:CBS domain-containing protein [Deltaproteobacteria bacterium]